MSLIRNVLLGLAMIFSLSMISISPAFAETFENPDYGFSIDYPRNWIVEDELYVYEPDLGYNEGTADFVIFYRDKSWTSYIDILFIKNDFLPKNYDGQKYLDRLEIELEEICQIRTLEWDGYLCSDYNVIDSKIIQIEGYDAYQVNASWIETFDDNTSFAMTGNHIDIPVGNNVWVITTGAPTKDYVSVMPFIQKSIDSFQFTNTGLEPKITFTNSGFLDEEKASTTSPSLIEDIDFATYKDPNFGFTVKYPDTWDVTDSFAFANGDYYPVSFYDDFDSYFSYMEIRYAEQEIWVPLENDAAELESLDEILESWCVQYTHEIHGYECKDYEQNYSRVISLDGQKQFEIGYSWKKIVDDDYWDNESILRIIPAKLGNWYLYAESHVSTIERDEDVLFHMLDSFVLPSSDVLLYDSLDSFYHDEPTLFENEKYGFSMTVPAGWGASDRDFDFGSFTATQFHPKEFSGSFSPVILSFVIMTQPYDLSDVKIQEELETFSEELMLGMSEYGEFETTFENLEVSDSMVKLTVRATEKTANPGYGSTAVDFELIGWISEKGAIHFLIFVAEKEDFVKMYPDFRVSGNSFEFFYEPPESDSPLRPAIPEWIRNNAGWWADGVISESDFIVGIEHLIRINVIQVEYSSTNSSGDAEIPLWVKSNAKWWSEQQISDEDFLRGIQFLIENGFVSINNPHAENIPQEST